MTNTIQYAVDQDGIALLTIDLPGMPMNVLTPELMEDLATLTARAASDDAVKGMVITSGKKAFIAGADIKDMVTAYDRGVTPREAAQFSGKLNQTLRKMETCGKPFVAALPGTALGGGIRQHNSHDLIIGPGHGFVECSRQDEGPRRSIQEPIGQTPIRRCLEPGR